MSQNNSPESADFGYRTVPRAAKARLVGEVFRSVAPKYDIMNDLMSLGIHRLWKREFCAALNPRPRYSLLDLATGTGDIAFAWLKHGGGPVTASDINEAMLDIARDRAANLGLVADIEFLAANAETLPLPDRTFDRVSMAFGLRNCTNKEKVIAQAYRVLKPGGRFFVLEFSQLQVAALEGLYDAWSFGALPRLGRLIAKDGESYQYLAESIRMFPPQEELARMFTDAGFSRVTWRNLSGGIAAIHAGWRL